MNHVYLPLIVFVLLVLEGVALELLPHSLVSGDLLIVPHWVLIYLIFIAIFYDVKNTSYSVIYAVVFGLLIDSVYVGVLGVYMFSYGISVYIIKRMTRFLQENVFTAMLLGVVGMIIAEFLINITFLVVGIVDFTCKTYFVYRFFLTLFANLLFIIILYPMMVRRLVKWKKERFHRTL